MRYKTVRTWMTPSPITIGLEETVLAAYEKMKYHNIRRLPVVEVRGLPNQKHPRLVGVITINDVRKLAPMGVLSILEKNEMIGNTKVKRIMTADPITLSPERSVGEAAWLMMKHDIGGLPVVENDVLVGLISEADLFRLMMAENWQLHTVSEIDPEGIETVSLADGETIHIRPIRPDDASLLQASHIKMSPETIYDRFMGYKSELPDKEAIYLTNLDYDRHMALVASVEQDGEETLIGVARYHILDEEPDCAEFAIVIADAYQRRGLGTHLMKRLMEYAQAHGIRTFLGITHLDNTRLLRFIQRSGLPIERTQKDGIWEVRMTLDGEPFRNPTQEEIAIAG
jgi:CBS domain-containing protein/RimJ/RimL family protein N-acetyltransferase